jgi:hypothetical protein
MVRTWYMYAYDDDDLFEYFGDLWWVKLHGLSNPIVPVRLTEDPEGRYYGWLATGEDEPNMIWPSKAQFEMCFPYGPKAEEERGRGQTVRLSVERLQCRQCGENKPYGTYVVERDGEWLCKDCL